MRLSVNPNRMVLLKLRRSLVLAERGHKLLEDKLDELIRLFLKSIQEAKKLQEETDLKTKDAFLSLLLARTQMKKEDFERSAGVEESLKIRLETKRVMNLNLPEVAIEKIPSIFNYSFINTSCELDIALLKFLDLIPKLIRLAELHKICDILAYEIERTRRRTNALEYILIPSLKETIDYITDRLSEFERANITRLMRIKEIIRTH